MVGAGVPMLGDAPADRRLAAPGDIGIDKAVGAAAGQIIVAETEPAPIVDVIVEPHVVGERLAAERAGLCRIGLQQHPHLGTQQLAGTEDAARLGGVLGRDVVGMRAVGMRRRQRQHSRPERGKDRQRRSRRLGRAIRRRPHRLEIAAHRRDRLAVDMAAHALDRRHVRDADPEQESPARLLGERALAVHHRHRVARIDVGDPRRDDQPRRVGEQPGRMDQHIAAAALGQPQRGIAPAFDALRKGGAFRRAQHIHRRPHAELAELHCPILT